MTEPSHALIPRSETSIDPYQRKTSLPEKVLREGKPGANAWDDYFEGEIANPNTKAAYERAVRKFLQWTDQHIPEKQLSEIMAHDLARYIKLMSGGIEKKKQHVSALRRFFDHLIPRRLILINPAHGVKTEKLVVTVGKTPNISDEQYRTLIAQINLNSVIGLRNLAMIQSALYTGSRNGAVCKLDWTDYVLSGDQMMLHFIDKGGKYFPMPVAHDLKRSIDKWIEVSGVTDFEQWIDCETGKTRRPLFVTATGRSGQLTNRPMKPTKFLKMFQYYAKKSGLPPNISPHSLKVAALTDLDDQNESSDSLQTFGRHADRRTTQKYIRTERKVKRNLVERIRIGR